MDEDNKGVATLGILAVMILVYSLLALMYHDARAIQYILFFVGYILILASIYIGYVLIMRTLF
ncbi:hypothetical protein [Porphyromonas uenonis]|uniref:hypothetical protein n=1 Tax=Porphyromonas uenonis TaxID=281920 RepID=UPI0028893D42|nr:hypothetical protein [Porphyromonas uenonis]